MSYNESELDCDDCGTIISNGEECYCDSCYKGLRNEIDRLTDENSTLLNEIESLTNQIEIIEQECETVKEETKT